MEDGVTEEDARVTEVRPPVPPVPPAPLPACRCPLLARLLPGLLLGARTPACRARPSRRASTLDAQRPPNLQPPLPLPLF